MEKKETTISRIKEIWSSAFWYKEADRIELAYWESIKHLLPDTPPPAGVAPPTEHKTEKFIRHLSRCTGIGNLHTGLTSSDIEDNVRIKRLSASMDVADEAIFHLLGTLVNMDDVTLLAYTHLIPAGGIMLSERLRPSIMAASSYPWPLIKYKGMGGSLGKGHIQQLIGKDRYKISNEVFPAEMTQTFSSQTVDHRTEFLVASWLSFQASILAKIANDFRMMFALGQAVHTQKDIGSTAIAGKNPNPWRFERVSGKAPLLYGLPGEISRIAADCLLERTLTNQSALDYLFENAFPLFVDLVFSLSEAVKMTKVIDQSAECKKDKYHTEEQVLRLIKKGMPRETAHLKINKKYATKK